MKPTSSNFVPAHYDEGWEYQPDLCPCDDEFLDYLSTYYLNPSNSDISLVFHMGPGLHHTLGIEFTNYPIDAFHHNRVLSYTVCPAELDAYNELHPNVHAYYTCLLRDVNDLSYILPRFDAISLFHLGEYQYDLPPFDRWKLHVRTLRYFAEHLWPNGIILLYTKSSAASIVLPIADDLFPIHEDYKSLRIYHP